MDSTTFLASLQDTLGTHLPGILGALGILIVGWIIAVAARAGVRKSLGLLKVNARITESTQQEVDVEKGFAVGVFWLVILVTLIGVFNSLHLEQVSNPFNALLTQVFAYLPRFAAGVLLLLLAWIVASAVRMLITKALGATDWDEKLSAEAGMQPMSQSVGNVLFWLIVLLFIPAILGAFDLQGLLEPVRGMINKTLDMLPNVVAALAIGFVGWVVAKVLRGLVANLLAAAGADKINESVGLTESVQIGRAHV